MYNIISSTIDPSIFYIAYASDILNTICTVIAIFEIVAIVAVYVEFRVAKEKFELTNNNEDIKFLYINTRRSVQRIFAIFCITIFGLIIFPPKSVIYKMAASKYVSAHNVEMTPEQIDSAVEKLIKNKK